MSSETKVGQNLQIVPKRDLVDLMIKIRPILQENRKSNRNANAPFASSKALTPQLFESFASQAEFLSDSGH